MNYWNLIDISMILIFYFISISCTLYLLHIIWNIMEMTSQRHKPKNIIRNAEQRAS